MSTTLPRTATTAPRFDEPVVCPSDDPTISDHCGMQDPRITPVGDEFLMTYCGWNYVRPNDVECNAMMARSRDLLRWEKLGDVPGLERVNNKDHVLFREPIHGKYFMLHRPMRPADNGEHMIELAVAERPEGPYTNLGKIMDAFPEQYPMFLCSKIGASAPPLPLGGNKWLVTYHYGHLVSSRFLYNGWNDFGGNNIIALQAGYSGGAGLISPQYHFFYENDMLAFEANAYASFLTSSLGTPTLGAYIAPVYKVVKDFFNVYVEVDPAYTVNGLFALSVNPGVWFNFGSAGQISVACTLANVTGTVSPGVAMWYWITFDTKKK